MPPESAISYTCVAVAIFIAAVLLATSITSLCRSDIRSYGWACFTACFAFLISTVNLLVMNILSTIDDWSFARRVSLVLCILCVLTHEAAWLKLWCTVQDLQLSLNIIFAITALFIFVALVLAVWWSATKSAVLLELLSALCFLTGFFFAGSYCIIWRHTDNHTLRILRSIVQLPIFLWIFASVVSLILLIPGLNLGTDLPLHVNLALYSICVLRIPIQFICKWVISKGNRTAVTGNESRFHVMGPVEEGSTGQETRSSTESAQTTAGPSWPLQTVPPL